MIIYRCNKCKNILMVLNKGMCIPNCCGEGMQELTPNTTRCKYGKTYTSS